MANGLTTDASGYGNDDKVEQTMERVRSSSKWLENNFWPELADAFRAYEVRSEPLVFPPGHPRAGQEDKTRTNIAMPEFFIAVRRKAVRKSARPPTIRVRAKDPDLAGFLSALATHQWDAAKEQRHQRRHVLQGDLLGISLKVHYYDQVSRVRALRRSVDGILDQLYAKIEEGTDGRAVVPVEEGTEGAIRADRLPDHDKASFILGAGPEMLTRERFTRFDGALSSWIFFGDWYPEPEFEDIQSSAWHVFEGVKDAEWLAYMAAQTFRDPRDGQERPVIDPKKLLELEEHKTFRSLTAKSKGQAAELDFRQTLRDVIFKSRPEVEARLIPGRRYLIHQDYTFRKGVCWLRFIGNEKVLLGEMPLPFDLGGRYPISSYTPIPSLLWGIGDSTPRKGRFLWKLHNVAVSMRTDLVVSALKKLVVLPKGADLPDEAMDLGLLRVMFSDHYREILQALQASGIEVPREAWEMEQQVMRMEQMLEPAMIDFGPESQGVPASQRLATLGILQQRAADAISADELEALNESIAEETDIKLSMWQQVVTQAELKGLSEALWTLQSPGGEGRPRKTWADPLELQQDFEVFPELASTLALDDQLRRTQALELYERAVAAPQVWNVREAARRLASTYNVPNAEELLAPELPPEPDMPEAKLNISIGVKFSELPEDVQAQMIEKLGFRPPADQELRALYEHLGKAAPAALAAQSLAGEESLAEGQQ